MGGRRRCLDCGTLVSGASRCRPCKAARTQFRNDEAERCRAAVQEHRRVHGNWCPGYGCPPHESDDLTADHVVARQRGGRLSVLCRRCNARKGNR